MKILKTSTLPNILKDVVVLRQKKLAENETEDMSLAFMRYKDATYETDNVYSHEYSIEELNAVGIFDNDDIINIRNDVTVLRSLLNDYKLDVLLNNKRKSIINNYVETNRYVKMLMGEPYDESERVFLDEIVEGLDMTKSIDEFDSAEIQLLIVKGIIDKLITKYPNLGYLKYVHRKIPFMTTRLADTFGLLYVDTSTNDGYRFLERYEMTRLTFKRTLYNQMYYDLYPLYEDMMISFISASALFDMMATEPYSIADFDFSSEDTLMSIYKTFSIPYLEKLPKQIRIALGERINKIILNKGSKSSLIDIMKAFGINDIYQYILYKEYSDKYDPNLSPEENYKLSFVKIPIDAKDVAKEILKVPNDERIDYDSFVATDKRWGVEGDNLKSYVLSQDFSYLRTKYIGVNETIDLMKDLTSASRFMSYIFYNKDKITNFRIKLQRSLIECNLWELMVYAITLIMNKNGYEDNIVRDLEAVSYVHGLNTEYVLSQDTIELFRKHLPDKYHKYIDDWIPLKRDVPITEFMKCFNDNINLMKELKSVLLNFDGPYSTYKYLCKIEVMMYAMKRNDALGELIDCETYSDYIKNNNHDLFTYLEILRHTEDSTTNMADELISIISDIDDILQLSNLSDTNLDNFYFVNKMKADEMDIIKISLFQIMAFLKTYTIDLKENEKVNKIYYTIKSIDNMMMNVYGNYYERSKTVDAITAVTTYSSLQSVVHISDTVRDITDNLQIMSDEYDGRSNNLLLDIVKINDSVTKNDISVIYDDKAYGNIWVENGIIKTTGIYNYIEGLSKASVRMYMGNAIITTPDNSFNCILYKDEEGRDKIYTGEGYKNYFIIPDWIASNNYYKYRIEDYRITNTNDGLIIDFNTINHDYDEGRLVDNTYYSHLVDSDVLDKKTLYFKCDVIDGHLYTCGTRPPKMDYRGFVTENFLYGYNACRTYNEDPPKYRLEPPFLTIAFGPKEVPIHYRWKFYPMVLPNDSEMKPFIPIDYEFPKGRMVFSAPVVKHYNYCEDDNADSIVLVKDTFYVESVIENITDKLDCTYSHWDIRDESCVEDRIYAINYDIDMTNVSCFLSPYRFLDSETVWIDSSGNGKNFDKVGLPNSSYDPFTKYVTFDGYTSRLQYVNYLFNTPNSTLTLDFKLSDLKNSSILFTICNNIYILLDENTVSGQTSYGTTSSNVSLPLNTDITFTVVFEGFNVTVYWDKIKILEFMNRFNLSSAETFALQNTVDGDLYKKNILYRRLIVHDVPLSVEEVYDLHSTLIALRNK